MRPARTILIMQLSNSRLNFIISLLCSFSQAPHGPRFQSRITLALIFYQIFVKEVHFFCKTFVFFALLHYNPIFDS